MNKKYQQPYLTYWLTSRRTVIIYNCTTYSLPKILQTNENSRNAQTLLTSSLLICNWNFLSYRRMHVCCLRKTVFNFFVNWCLDRFPHLCDFPLKCVQCLAVRTTYTCVNLWSSFLPRCIVCNAVLVIVKPYVRLSVRPSVCQTRALWQNESN